MANDTTQGTHVGYSVKVLKADGSLVDHGVVSYRGDDPVKRAFFEAERAAGRLVSHFDLFGHHTPDPVRPPDSAGDQSESTGLLPGEVEHADDGGQS